MITRAYQNSKGERQEVTLSPEVWESITDVDLENILGFAEEPEVVSAPEAAEAPEAAVAPEAAEAPEEVAAPVKQKAPVKKRQAK
jgi:hypothetical protein